MIADHFGDGREAAIVIHLHQGEYCQVYTDFAGDELEKEGGKSLGVGGKIRIRLLPDITLRLTNKYFSVFGYQRIALAEQRLLLQEALNHHLSNFSVAGECY